MIELLLLSSTFFIVLFIGIVVMVLHLKRWFHIRVENQRKDIEELKELFKNDIKKIIDGFTNILKN